jgi:hypothetical protein
MNIYRNRTTKKGNIMSENKTERPELVTEEHLEFLDWLREEGTTNMYGARPYLMGEFPDLSKNEAGEILMYWMRSFGERHPSSE